MSETGEDCHFFMTTGCTKGTECGFRHSDAAKENPKVCRHWLSNSCSKLGCTYRHPTRTAASPAGNLGMMAAMGGMMPGFGAGVSGPGGGGGGGGGSVCVFYMKGKCNKGPACPFLHPFVDPYQMQMQMLQQMQLQQQQQQQQQQFQEEAPAPSARQNKRGPKAEREEPKKPKEKRELSESEKEALLAKPLKSGTVSKKSKQDKPRTEIAAAAPAAKRVKPAAVATPVATAAPVQIKSLAQIMAEKNKGGSGGVSPVAAASAAPAAPAAANAGDKKKKSQEDAVDAELRAMGLDPKDLDMDAEEVDIVM
jgi:hypothetical protein